MSLQEKDNTTLGEGPHGHAPSDYPTPGQTLSEASDEGHHNHVHDDNLQGHPQASVERPQSLADEALFVAVICSSQLLAQAGFALSIVPQHIIARSFGIENEPGKVS